MKKYPLLNKLNHISKIPKHGTDDYKLWLEQKEFLQFLIDTSSGEIPLYVSCKGAFIYSVFLPQSSLKGKYIDDLMKWDCNPCPTWGYRYSPRTISSPFDFSGSKLLRSATPITILRSFEGRIGTEKSYIVANQLLTHPNDLHYENERSAYCRLNEDGDVEEVIKVRHKPGEKLVTITQDILDKHLFLTNSVLVRFFDRNLCNDWMGFVERGGRKETKIQDKRNKIYARQVMAFDKDKLPTAGALRGFQIINNRLSRKKIKLLTGEPSKP